MADLTLKTEDVTELEDCKKVGLAGAIDASTVITFQATLDKWNQLKRCSFMEEMAPYCDTRQRILKPVLKFLDERDYLIKKCRDLFILDDVRCEGTNDFGACDRACYFFWRKEWLEIIPDQN